MTTPSRRSLPAVDWSIHEHALCAGRTHDMFPEPPTREITRNGAPFTHANHQDPAYLATVEAARTICVGCPVASACLAEALATPVDSDRWGIRAGYTPRERMDLRDRPLFVRAVRIAAREEARRRRADPTDLDPRTDRPGHPDRHRTRRVPAPSRPGPLDAIGARPVA